MCLGVCVRARARFELVYSMLFESKARIPIVDCTPKKDKSKNNNSYCNIV